MQSSEVAPCATKAATIAAFTRSHVSASPSTTRPPAPALARRSRSRAAPMPASAACCARRMPASSAFTFERRRLSNKVLLGGQLDSAGAEHVGGPQRERLGDERRGDPERPHRAQHDLLANLGAREPLRDQLVGSVLLRAVQLVAPDLAQPRRSPSSRSRCASRRPSRHRGTGRGSRSAPRGAARASEMCLRKSGRRSWKRL